MKAGHIKGKTDPVRSQTEVLVVRVPVVSAQTYGRARRQLKGTV